jgi:hypothetical protein
MLGRRDRFPNVLGRRDRFLNVLGRRDRPKKRNDRSARGSNLNSTIPKAQSLLISLSA